MARTVPEWQSTRVGMTSALWAVEPLPKECSP